MIGVSMKDWDKGHLKLGLIVFIISGGASIAEFAMKTVGRRFDLKTNRHSINLNQTGTRLIVFRLVVFLEIDFNTRCLRHVIARVQSEIVKNLPKIGGHVEL